MLTQQLEPRARACGQLHARWCAGAIEVRGRIGEICLVHHYGHRDVLWQLEPFALVARGRRIGNAVNDEQNAIGPGHLGSSASNTLGFDEVAVEAVVRPPRGRIEGGFLKLERRVGDFATAGVAVSVDFVGDRIEHLGIALTGVGPRTLYVAAADDELRGSTLDTAAVTRAADLASETAQPSADHRGSAEYKRHVIHTFVRRILTRIADSSERAA